MRFIIQIIVILGAIVAASGDTNPGNVNANPNRQGLAPNFFWRYIGEKPKSQPNRGISQIFASSQTVSSFLKPNSQSSYGGNAQQQSTGFKLGKHQVRVAPNFVRLMKSRFAPLSNIRAYLLGEGNRDLGSADQQSTLGQQGSANPAISTQQPRDQQWRGNVGYPMNPMLNQPIRSYYPPQQQMASPQTIGPMAPQSFRPQMLQQSLPPPPGLIVQHPSQGLMVQHPPSHLMTPPSMESLSLPTPPAPIEPQSFPQFTIESIDFDDIDAFKMKPFSPL